MTRSGRSLHYTKVIFTFAIAADDIKDTATEPRKRRIDASVDQSHRTNKDTKKFEQRTEHAELILIRRKREEEKKDRVHERSVYEHRLE